MSQFCAVRVPDSVQRLLSHMAPHVVRSGALPVMIGRDDIEQNHWADVVGLFFAIP